MRRIALVNQKGGCGKTTTAVNLACCLAEEGKKIILIDLDPQGHVGIAVGAKADQVETTIYEVLLGETHISEAIQTLNENLDAIFSDVVLSAFEQVMAGAHEREYKFARSLVDIENNYDYLIIDSPPSVGLLTFNGLITSSDAINPLKVSSPPSVGLLTFNGLIASEEVIIPVDPSSFSLHGVGKLLDTIQIIQEKPMKKLDFIRITLKF